MEINNLILNPKEFKNVANVFFFCLFFQNKSDMKKLQKHNITKFGKLMSVVVLKSWPTDVNEDHAEVEDLIFQYLLDWDMAETVFQMAGNCKMFILLLIQAWRHYSLLKERSKCMIIHCI